MKNLKTILTALCVGAIIASCSKSELGHTTDSNLAIRLSAGLTLPHASAPKAVIGTGTEFTAAIAGWQSESASADYTAVADWLRTSNITASELSSAVTLDPQPYYSQNSKVKSYIRAWYPAGTLAAGVVSFDAPTDGTVDLLLSNEVSGSAIDNGPKTLTFGHMLMQLTFTVVSDAAVAAATIKSITIKDAELPTALTLSTGALSYAATIALSVPQIDGTQAITTTATSVGQPVMIKPFVGKTFIADIETSVNRYQNVVITIDGADDFVAAKSYTIKLSFSSANTQVAVSASVTPWATGTGSGNIPVKSSQI